MSGRNYYLADHFLALRRYLWIFCSPFFGMPRFRQGVFLSGTYLSFMIHIRLYISASQVGAG
jgi:hypothetical protein